MTPSSGPWAATGRQPGVRDGTAVRPGGAQATSELRPRLAELPFGPRALFELLGFELGREALSLDYTGFGWARPARLWLQGAGPVQVVEQPLVLALHSADDGPALASDILLELVLSDDTGGAVATPLSRFLQVWLPRLPAHGPVVLALCNPHRAALPALPGGRALWYAHGDVDSWLDAPTGPLQGEDELRAQGHFRLSAASWHRV